MRRERKENSTSIRIHKQTKRTVCRVYGIKWATHLVCVYANVYGINPLPSLPDIDVRYLRGDEARGPNRVTYVQSETQDT